MSAVATPITAEDIGRRILKLIDSIRSAQDLAPEHIERETGIHVEFSADDPNVYGFGGDLNQDWAYNLISSSEKIGAKPTSLHFSFDDRSAGRDADPASICGMDFDDYRRAMTSAGFESKPMYGYRGLDSWYFSRDDVGILAYTHGNANPDEGKACISRIIISAYA